MDNHGYDNHNDQPNSSEDHVQKNNYCDDDDEYIFSWIKSDPMINPATMRCKNCNYQVNNIDNNNINNKTNEVTCKNCGYQIKLYGYPTTVYSGPYDIDQPSDLINEDAFTEQLRDGNDQMMPMEPSDYAVERDDDQIAQLQIEHMTSDDDSSNLIMIIVCRLFLFVFALLIASVRKELTTSACLCIFLFPELYFSYVLVDVFVFGSHFAKTESLQ